MSYPDATQYRVQATFLPSVLLHNFSKERNTCSVQAIIVLNRYLTYALPNTQHFTCQLSVFF